MGGTVTIRGEQFTVVGILDKTLTAPDTEVFMTLPDAQRLFMQDLPEVVPRPGGPAATWSPRSWSTPLPGTDPEALAAAINEAVPGVQAMGPSAFQEQIASFMGIFNAILYGIAIIALFVGGLSVINTMTMSVNERTREIGVRKAIGASDGQIVGQFLAESGVIGLIGGRVRPVPGLAGRHRGRQAAGVPQPRPVPRLAPAGASARCSSPCCWVW